MRLEKSRSNAGGTDYDLITLVINPSGASYNAWEWLFTIFPVWSLMNAEAETVGFNSTEHWPNK